MQNGPDMISFTCDYNEGAHPQILERLLETNFMQEPGYGEDRFSRSAKERIREAAGHPDADVFFLTGGTQTNKTVIAALLRSYEGVVAAETGHISVHEAGAVEYTGHKVLTLSQHDGKIDPEELEAFLVRFHADPTAPHMVQPGMVYLSFPTEYGTLYSKEDLTAIQVVCRRYGMPLFIDGARLGYGLMSRSSGMNLRDLASCCDVFTIGGTKVGALCGEAVVFPKSHAPAHFFTTIKQHGALLAKGRLLGIQFDTLFTDGLYFEISRHAIEMAEQLKDLFLRRGIDLYIDSPTNQQFVLLDRAARAALEGKVQYEIWGEAPDGRTIVRFATSWATTKQQLSELEELLQSC